MEQMKRWADYVLHPLISAAYLPSCQQIARIRQAGRSQGFHNHVDDPKDAFHGFKFPCLHFKDYQARIMCREVSSARTSKGIKSLLKERWDFNLVGIAAVKSCNDQEA